VSRPPLTPAEGLRWHAVRRRVVAEAGVPARLRRLYRLLNSRHFGGRLPELPIRLSARMGRRLGRLKVDRASKRPVEIVLSRRHVEQQVWEEIEQTLLDQMGQLRRWQDEVPPQARRAPDAAGGTP
jgi:hypothetical protein